MLSGDFHFSFVERPSIANLYGRASVDEKVDGVVGEKLD
jgi:hypothetical protein